MFTRFKYSWKLIINLILFNILVLDTANNICKSCYKTCKTCLEPDNSKFCLTCIDSSYILVKEIN